MVTILRTNREPVQNCIYSYFSMMDDEPEVILEDGEVLQIQQKLLHSKLNPAKITL